MQDVVNYCCKCFVNKWVYCLISVINCKNCILLRYLTVQVDCVKQTLLILTPAKSKIIQCFFPTYVVNATCFKHKNEVMKICTVIFFRFYIDLRLETKFKLKDRSDWDNRDDKIIVHITLHYNTVHLYVICTLVLQTKN